jgi:hypothetical protein
VLNQVGLTLNAFNNAFISINLKFFVSKRLDGVVVHDTLVLVKLLLFVQVLAVSDLDHTLL